MAEAKSESYESKKKKKIGNCKNRERVTVVSQNEKDWPRQNQKESDGSKPKKKIGNSLATRKRLTEKKTDRSKSEIIRTREAKSTRW